MIQELVQMWDANKAHLEASLRESQPERYDQLVERLLTLVLSDEVCPPNGWGCGRIDPTRTTEIDHGDYQGTRIYLLCLEGYQPTEGSYLWFSNAYGSCSGCDALEDANSLPESERVAALMTLALHMVQRIRWLAAEDVA